MEPLTLWDWAKLSEAEKLARVEEVIIPTLEELLGHVNDESEKRG